MTPAQDASKVLLFTAQVSVGGAVDVPGLKDNCTCSQGRYETAATEDSSLREIARVFDPSKIGSISDFVQLRDSLRA